MKKTGEQFIHSKDQDLHHSKEVEAVVAYLKSSGEKIPNNPADKISAYLGFLANKDFVDDGIFTGSKDSIDRQIEQLLIKDENVPESYFQLQQRIAFEQGHGYIEITISMRHQLVEAIRADQKSSLNKWAEYINGPDGTYPVWFEYFVWESLKKLGQFDKEKGEFTKRTKSITAPYPELNREALAYVYDKLYKSLDGKIDDEPEKLQQLLRGGNFGKLYAHALLEATCSKEFINTIAGSWKRYDRTDDPRTARRLSDSLQGYGTGWCTAGQKTASKQLQGGDFYVYYTKDEEGKDTVPRVAIRMEKNEVAEVRGILVAQELEPALYDIVNEKLNELPGGEEYKQKVVDMKKVTKIYNLVKNDPEAELSVEDLRFIYEIDRKIKRFGYFIDPRIIEIITNRNSIFDYSQIYETKDQTELAKILMAEGRAYVVAENLDKFLAKADHTELAKVLLAQGYACFVTQNLDKFTPGSVDQTELAKVLMAEGIAYVVAENLDKFTPGSVDYTELAKVLIAQSYTRSVAENLDKFKLSEEQKKQLGIGCDMS